MQENNSKPAIVLIAFYNTKALGIRYLESTLIKKGFLVYTVFYKNFNSINPLKTTEKELELLTERIKAVNPILVGLSVMSSMYLDTVECVINKIKTAFPQLPTVFGGAFISMFPKRFLSRDGLDFSIRLDGENTMSALAEALQNGEEYKNIPSLGYCEYGRIILNEIGGIKANIDEYGLPAVYSEHSCCIENGKLTEGDPQLNTLSYELIASRGCPFTCSYCCCVNLSRLYPKGIKPVRTRSVKSVIDELKLAKKVCKKLVFVHFYDEIFPNLPGWVDEFVAEYKKHIKLPFTIWSHPKMIDEEMLRKLKSIGLTEVIMGIQSGSSYIRKEIFHRYESNDDIVEATRAIHNSGVFWASYDFMLRHPFETPDTLKDTYYLIKKMHGRFELQLHGLNFLPGTDIVQLAIDKGYLTDEEVNSIMYAPMGKQFDAYWYQENGTDSQLWYEMIYLLQFRFARKKVAIWENNPIKYKQKIDALYTKAQKIAKLRYYYKKAWVVFKSKFHIY